MCVLRTGGWDSPLLFFLGAGLPAAAARPLATVQPGRIADPCWTHAKVVGPRRKAARARASDFAADANAITLFSLLRKLGDLKKVRAGWVVVVVGRRGVPRERSVRSGVWFSGAGSDGEAGNKLGSLGRTQDEGSGKHALNVCRQRSLADDCTPRSWGLRLSSRVDARAPPTHYANDVGVKARQTPHRRHRCW